MQLLCTDFSVRPPPHRSRTGHLHHGRLLRFELLAHQQPLHWAGGLLAHPVTHKPRQCQDHG